LVTNTGGGQYSDAEILSDLLSSGKLIVDDMQQP